MNDERNESVSEWESGFISGETESVNHTMTRWDGEAVTITVGKSISKTHSKSVTRRDARSESESAKSESRGRSQGVGGCVCCAERIRREMKK